MPLIGTKRRGRPRVPRHRDIVPCRRGTSHRPVRGPSARRWCDGL